MSLAETWAARARTARLNAGAATLDNRALVASVSGLFLLPVTIFAVSLRPLPAIATIAGSIAALTLILADGRRSTDGILSASVDLRRLLLAIGVAAVLMLIGGETHLLYATPDWLVRDAVLADLVRFGFPVSYVVDGTTYLLRAPLGMYFGPALVGRVFGLAAAHVALLAQNALMFGSIFYLMMSLGRGWPHLVLLVLFGGLSIVGAGLRDSLQPAAVHDFGRWSLDSWHPLFQYSSSMVQFVWVPNHALPGWWLATLFLLQRRAGLDAATLGVSVAALSFWSPLAVLPALPWLAWQGCTAWRTVMTSPRTWLGMVAAACFAPAALYLVSASGTIAHGSDAARPDFGFWYATFILIQLPALVFLGVCWRRVPSDLRGLLLVNALVLLGLPFLRFGPNNDLVMRGSTASLAVVAFVFGLVLLEATRRKAPAAIAGWMIAIASSPSAALEIWRSVSMPAYGISDCTLMQASHALDGARLPTNYVATVEAIPPRLMNGRTAAVAPTEARACWPDLPLPR